MEYTIILLLILLIPTIGSFAGYILGQRSERRRDLFNIKITGVNLILVTILYKPVSIQPIDITINHIMGTGLHLRLDMFRFIFVWITSLVWFLATIYSTHYLIKYKNRNRYYFFFIMTLGSTIGLFISENLLNLFTFFEIMSFTSYALIIHDEDDYSHDAGYTYIVTAVAGGLTLLMGLFLLYNYTQTLDISSLYQSVQNIGNIKYLISTLMIIGFGIKAGMVPLHIWLPKAHPAAPAPASAVLSGILLKTGIFGIILTVDIILKGDYYVSLIILSLGLINMFLGGFLALFQRNIKRIFAYSSMSQIGYILCGIGLYGILGEYNFIAMLGTLFHVVNHAIFKVLLFMGAGVIYMLFHELSINEIGGFLRSHKTLKIIFIIGSLAISGAPGFNGYASKTILHEALSKAHVIHHNNFLTLAEIIFTLSSALTVAYMLKIFFALFVDESQQNFENIQERISKIAFLPLLVLCAFVILIGFMPDYTLNILKGALYSFGENNKINIHFFSFESIRSSVFTISLGVIIYFLFVRRVLRKASGNSWYYVNPALNWFNIENDIYMPAGRAAFRIGSIILKFVDEALIGSVTYIGKIFEKIGEVEIDLKDKMIFIIKKESLAALNEFMKIGKQKERFNEIKHEINSEKIEKPILSLKEIIRNLNYNLNSINSSIFIFAFVLVALLLILIVNVYWNNCIFIL